MAIHYAVQGNPHPRLLAALHAAGCRFEAVSWSEVRAAMRAGADPSAVLFTQPVKPADDIARARRAGVWRFAADSDTEPGRAIAAPAGTTFATVTGTAWRGGTLRVSLDTGAFHGLIEALESGRQLAFPVTIPAAGNRPRVPCMLTGPSCDSQDTILDRVWLPTPRADDQVLIGNAGAYTTCYSGRSALNGYPAPAIKITKTAAACSPLDEKAEFTITAASDDIQDSA